MVRVVTADHVVFTECVWAFRPPELPGPSLAQGQKADLVGYVLLDFESHQTWEFEHFVIQPVHRVPFPDAYAAFVAPVSLPPWLDHLNGHLFTTALSAVCSFATGRPATAPRDPYWTWRPLGEPQLLTLGIQFPVLVAGPGSHDSTLSQETATKLYNAIVEITSILLKLRDKDYIQVMRAIRLVHLAHLNKRMGFALAYYLLVSAIESVAQYAIEREKFAKSHPSEQRWKELAKHNADVKELLGAYRQERGNSRYLKRRFVEFVFDYCPPCLWHEMSHPMDNLASRLGEVQCELDWSWLPGKKWWEVYPADLSEEMVRRILSDAYDHRSGFTHGGKPPPHRQPNSTNRFFDIQYELESRGVKRIVLPTFRLMAFIAQRSITTYAESRIQAA